MTRARGMRDSRVLEVIRRARLDLDEPSDATWESSDGTVRAVNVRLHLDGYAIGLWNTWPAVRDGVIEAIAAEAPRIVGATVLELDVVWALRERGPESGYRDAPTVAVDPGDPGELRRAVIGFLLASGAIEQARAIADDPEAELPRDVVGALRAPLRGT